jgi:DNA-binding GntR family transcriptional regulator
MPTVASRVHPPTSAIVAQHLRQAILAGEIAAGSKLRQDAVALRYQVSQVSAREAFRLLVAEGLLVAEPRRGVTVAPLSAEEAQEITDLRVMLEGEALSRAIPKLREADFATLQGLAASLDRATEIDTILDLNARFHATLYAPADRAKTLAMIATLRLNFERYLRLVWARTQHLYRSQREHEALLRLCARRDRKGAVASLRAHIQTTGATIIKHLARR